MALYVNTNVSSINAQRKLSNATLNLNTSYQRPVSYTHLTLPTILRV